MPLYDYKCCNCHNVFEFLAKHGDFDEDGKLLGLQCPFCLTKNPDHFIKQINRNTNFHLEGGGWYADGYNSTKKEGK